MRTIQRPSISTQSPESLGYAFISSTGSVAFPASNDAIFIPFKIERYALVKKMFCANGNVASGNIDMGIFTRDGKSIASIGSTAQAGTTALQFFAFSSNVILSPGQYYMAVAMNNTTGTLRRFNISIIRQQHFGVLKATSAFPLPSGVNLTTVTSTYVPNVGMELLGIS